MNSKGRRGAEVRFVARKGLLHWAERGTHRDF